MAAACPARPPHPLQPGSPATAVFAADRSPRRSVAAPQIGCPFRCPTQNCPCATAPPAARRAWLHCWLAPRYLHGQRPTAPDGRRLATAVHQALECPLQVRPAQGPPVGWESVVGGPPVRPDHSRKIRTEQSVHYRPTPMAVDPKYGQLGAHHGPQPGALLRLAPAGFIVATSHTFSQSTDTTVSYSATPGVADRGLC